MDGHGQPALLYIVPFTLGNEDGLGLWWMDAYVVCGDCECRNRDGCLM
jgi:hypothetical protein